MANIVETFGLRVTKPVAVTKIYNDSFFKSLTLPEIANDEMVGIEVEIENADGGRMELNAAWQVTDDGSLRNGGREFITRPVKARDTPILLTHLFRQYLNTENCCFSPRTSVHVHLNVQDFEYDQLFSFVSLYSMFEKYLFQFVGRGRKNNIYCVPISESSLITNLIEKNPGRDWSKYTSLNLLPVATQGTVEFRHMHGTADVQKLCQWIGMITRLKSYVKSQNTKELRVLISSLSDKTDIFSLAAAVFGEYADLLKLDNDFDVGPAKIILTSSDEGSRVYQRNSTNSLFHQFKI